MVEKKARAHLDRRRHSLDRRLSLGALAARAGSRKRPSLVQSPNGVLARDETEQLARPRPNREPRRLSGHKQPRHDVAANTSADTKAGLAAREARDPSFAQARTLPSPGNRPERRCRANRSARSCKHESAHDGVETSTAAEGVKRLRPISRDVRRSTDGNRDLLYEPDKHLNHDAGFPRMRGGCRSKVSVSA